MRKDILDRKPEILGWIKERMSKTLICSKLECQPGTLESYLIKMNIIYKGNKGGRGSTKPFNGVKYLLEDILEGKHPQYQSYKLKQRLYKAGLKENKCELCGIDEWNSRPIECELDHIDGIRTNHKMTNLRILCPNCHSQTSTFRAKNIKRRW
ncbi:MAG: HNH endonuclease signature motif containing protein [Candidatus Izemoplasma sp.]